MDIFDAALAAKLTGVPKPAAGDNGKALLANANGGYTLTNLGPGISYEVVSELPSTGEAGVIYLVANGAQSGTNIYDEYIWTGSGYEKIGTTESPVLCLEYDASNTGNITCNVAFDEIIQALSTKRPIYGIVKTGSAYYPIHEINKTGSAVLVRYNYSIGNSSSVSSTSNVSLSQYQLKDSTTQGNVRSIIRQAINSQIDDLTRVDIFRTSGSAYKASMAFSNISIAYNSNRRIVATTDLGEYDSSIFSSGSTVSLPLRRKNQTEIEFAGTILYSNSYYYVNIIIGASNSVTVIVNETIPVAPTSTVGTVYTYGVDGYEWKSRDYTEMEKVIDPGNQTGRFGITSYQFVDGVFHDLSDPYCVWIAGNSSFTQIFAVMETLASAAGDGVTVAKSIPDPTTAETFLEILPLSTGQNPFVGLYGEKYSGKATNIYIGQHTIDLGEETEHIEPYVAEATYRFKKTVDEGSGNWAIYNHEVTVNADAIIIETVKHSATPLPLS